DRARFPLQHMLAEGAAAPEDAVEIDIDDIQPMLILDLLGRGLAAGNASIANQDINLAMTLDRLGRNGIHAACAGDIDHHAIGLAASFLDRRDATIDQSLIEIGDDNRGAGFRQGQAASEADIAATTGDDSNAPIEFQLFEIHGVQSCWSSVRGERFLVRDPPQRTARIWVGGARSLAGGVERGRAVPSSPKRWQAASLGARKTWSCTRVR